MHRDFAEMLQALSAEGVEVLIVGGVAFDEAWPERVSGCVDGVEFQMISKRHLLANERATGRPQDLADVARLESLP